MSRIGVGSLYAENITAYERDGLVNMDTASGDGNLTLDPSGSAHYVRQSIVTPDYGQMQLQLSVRRLHLYYIPSVYCLTLLGNAFGNAVLTDPRLRRLPSTQYLIGILAVEVIHSLTRLHQWIEDNGWETGLYNIGGWCQFATFTSHIAGFLRTWYTVMLAVDCYVCHYVPSWSRTLCREWVAQCLLAGIGIVAIVVYLNISMLYGTVVVGPQLVCTQLQMFSVVHEHLDYGDVVINAAIPSATISVLMVLIGRGRCCRGPAVTRAGQRTDGPTEEDHLKPENVNRKRADTVRHQPPTGSVVFTLCFLALHLTFCLPVDIYRCVGLVKHFTLPAPHGATLEGFLIEQILGFVRWTKCALNLFVLFGAYPLFRVGFDGLPARVSQSVAGCSHCGSTRERQDILEV